MSDFLTQRGSVWHFVRRVPRAFAALDRRGVIRHSTRIRVADDRNGSRAARVARTLNLELESYWQSLAGGAPLADATAYDEARKRARALGFDYIDNAQLVMQPIEKILQRIEAMVANGLVGDSGVRTALLGTATRPSFMLSRLFEEFEMATKDEIKAFSPDQLRIWRNSHKRAVEQFVKVVGDKPMSELKPDDGIDYAEWWRARVINGEVEAKTANRDIGQLSRMVKEMNTWRRLGLPNIFTGLRLRGEKENSRIPYDSAFIQNRFLCGDELRSLNEDARFVLYVMVETGMRPSEIVNLRQESIILDAEIPHVRVLPIDRKLKTEDSERELPLVGVSLEALKLKPNGFPKYRDKSAGLSATVNKYLQEHGLRPTKDHSLYSLRHSFKDRLTDAEAPDSMIDHLMGHKTYKPKYGKGPSLALKRKFLDKIALVPPSRL